MKIYGPYTRKDGRKHICIIYNDGTRQTKSYPRYLLEVFLKRDLLPEEHVDHINGDFTDNRIENLQILTLQENASKSFKDRKAYRKTITFLCPQCNKETTKFENDVKHNRKQNKSGPFCSRSCAGKFTYINPWR